MAKNDIKTKIKIKMVKNDNKNKNCDKKISKTW